MVELEQYKFTVNQYKEPMKELGVSLALSHKHEQIKELESEMREEGFWNDPDKAQEVTRKVKNLKDTVSAYHALELTLDDVSTMIELGNEENDASVIPDIEELLGEFEIECFTECIANGRTVTALRQKFLIISMEMRQESSPLHLK